MERFSRILVALFAVIILQSSLGTNYAKADLSNIATWRFGIGTTSSYIKFNNGLLICWGWVATQRAEIKTVYLPVSYANDAYKVATTSESATGAGTTLISLTVNSKGVSSFKVKGAFHVVDVSSGYPSEAFDWITIGQWK